MHQILNILFNDVTIIISSGDAASNKEAFVAAEHAQDRKRRSTWVGGHLGCWRPLPCRVRGECYSTTVSRLISSVQSLDNEATSERSGSTKETSMSSCTWIRNPLASDRSSLRVVVRALAIAASVSLQLLDRRQRAHRDLQQQRT